MTSPHPQELVWEDRSHIRRSEANSGPTSEIELRRRVEALIASVEKERPPIERRARDIARSPRGGRDHPRVALFDWL
jgi:hypothetical protein